MPIKKIKINMRDLYLHIELMQKAIIKAINNEFELLVDILKRELGEGIFIKMEVK